MKKRTTKKGTEEATTKLIYSTIDDLPLWNFKKVIETKELRFLNIDLKNVKDWTEHERIWGEINEQVNAFNGVSDLYQKWIILQTDFEILQIDWLATRDKNLITQINIKSKQIERLLAQLSDKEVDMDRQIAAVELFFKFQINEKKTSVKRFLNYVKIMQADGRRQN